MKFTTEIKKGYHGWVGKSETKIGDKDWKITTMKRYNGVISTIAQSGVKEERDGYSTFTFVMYQDPSIGVSSNPGVRATQKAIDNIHMESLKTFETLYQEKYKN